MELQTVTAIEAASGAHAISVRDLNNLNELLKYNLVYAASPYQHYPHGLDRACEDIGEVCWWLNLAGVSHFSPILYGHNLSKIWGVDRADSHFWLDFDSGMMNVCDALVIVGLDGWADSAGVAIEQAAFESAGKPIYHLDPITLELRRE